MLSVIIVNYNVPYFLEQAILSVQKAIQHIDTEIIVVDNASKDKSVEMVQQKFPDVTLIANHENVGFSKANNQGIKIAKGKYVLLLNPDTVVQEDTFEKCIAFIEKHPKAGALGVKMIDGKGNFLPESKRALPTPKIAFFKAFGLSALFPKSPLFGRYHLGHLSENENHEVEVLAGAFMFMRKSVLDKVGGLDETFFMYGEDIDLSYRIILEGFKNYYLADTSIIHYKGESTKKGSLNYVKIFYEAMLIFAKKHFSSGQAKIYSLAIYFAIFLKGTLTLLSNFIRKITLPFIDFIFAFLGLYFIKDFWAFQIKDGLDYYPPKFTFIVIPIYIMIWIITAYIVGLYDSKFKTKKIFKSVILGTLIIAAIYGFLPENLRFSRAIILIGGAWFGLAILMVRLLLNFIIHRHFSFEIDAPKRIVIVGNGQEAKRALTLLKQSINDANFLGFIGYENSNKHENVLGEYYQLEDIVSVFNIDEIIFCTHDIPAHKVITTMTNLGERYNYKILPSQSESIIGSDSKNTSGDLYAIDVHLNLAQSRAKTLKRLMDVMVSILLFLSFPITFWIMKEKLGFLQNILKVFSGKKTWVGYIPNKTKSNYTLPNIPPSVVHPSIKINIEKDTIIIDKLNLIYAKDYSIEEDILLLLSNFRALGKN
jgi:GT2 family glycosyltransferase